MLIVIFIVFWKIKEINGKDCESYKAWKAWCKEIILLHGQVCYDWNLRNPSIATFNCQPDYELSPSVQRLNCTNDCLGCRHYWDGTPPVCQKKDSTTSIRTTTSVLESATTQRYRTVLTRDYTTQDLITISTASANSTTYLDLHLTGQNETHGRLAVYVAVPVVILCLIGLVLLIFIIYRKRQDRGNDKLPQAGNNNTRICVSTRAVTNKAYDPEINSATILGVPPKDENAYANTTIVQEKGLYANTLVKSAELQINNEKTADKSTADETAYECTSAVQEKNRGNLDSCTYSKINGYTVKSSEGNEEYDHLNANVHAVNDNTYSHTSQIGDVDTYSYTKAAASRSASETYYNNLSMGEHDAE